MAQRSSRVVEDYVEDGVAMPDQPEEQLTQIRLNVSTVLFRAAVYQLEQAEELEKTACDPRVSGNFVPHLSCCAACINLSIAYLEAFILEFLSFPRSRDTPLTTEQVANIAILKDEERRMSLIDRFANAANILSGRIEKGHYPAQAVKLAVALREYFTHPHSERTTRDLDPITLEVSGVSELESIIDGKKFAKNPFARHQSNLFQFNFLSAELCHWVLSACFCLVREFNSAVGNAEDPHFHIHEKIAHDARLKPPSR